MSKQVFTRRDFSARMAALLPALALTVGAFRSTASATNATKPPGDDGISRTAEAIHQDLLFKGNPGRFYEAILNEKQFSELTGSPAEINREPGGTFTLFGSAIRGRSLELLPGQRIVQAWRSEGWKAGHYSIVRFELAGQGSATRLVFDHTGFPTGQAENLARGWKEHYWDNLRKFLS